MSRLQAIHFGGASLTCNDRNTSDVSIDHCMLRWTRYEVTIGMGLPVLVRGTGNRNLQRRRLLGAGKRVFSARATQSLHEVIVCLLSLRLVRPPQRLDCAGFQPYGVEEIFRVAAFGERLERRRNSTRAESDTDRSPPASAVMG